MAVEAGQPAPLHGVRVVDLSRLLPGPFCSWVLGSLGAEVLRVEPPNSGDYTRDMPPVVSGHGVFYAAINRGKRSIALDWRVPEGLDALRRLLHTADVLIEGFKPGAMRAAGLDPAALRESHPRLVIASISGYGQTGAMATEPGHDLNYLGLAGIVAADEVGGAPYPVQVADLAGGALMAAVGINAALFQRERSGQGSWLDISMTEGAMALMGPHIATALGGDRDLSPGDELLSGGYAAYRTYRCADGKLITMAPLEPKFLAQFCALAGLDGAGLDAPSLARLFASRSRDAWVELLRGVCVGPALAARELPDHPLHRSRAAFEPVLGVPMPRSPFPWAASAEVATLGADTAALLGGLGLDLSALAAAGAIRSEDAGPSPAL